MGFRNNRFTFEKFPPPPPLLHPNICLLTHFRTHTHTNTRNIYVDIYACVCVCVHVCVCKVCVYEPNLNWRLVLDLSAIITADARYHIVYPCSSAANMQMMIPPSALLSSVSPSLVLAHVQGLVGFN